MFLELAGGLDDIATERQLTSGWSFVVLPKPEVARFSGEAQKLLPPGLAEFHARGFNSGSVPEFHAYRDFLLLLRQTAEGAPGSVLASSLNDQTWHADLTSFAARLVSNNFGTLGITDSAVINGAADAAPPLFTLQRLLNSPFFASTVLRSLEIDRSTETGQFASRTISSTGGSLPAPHLLGVLADAYRRQLFPRSPELDRSGIAIVDSSKSFLVQAADVLGNFSMNYLIRNLGPTTPGRTKKAEIFEDVFRDLLPQTHFGNLVLLSSPALELALKQAGALTFKVEHV